MDPLGMVIGVLIAAVLVVVAVYFAWRQQTTLHEMGFNTGLTQDHRHYLLRQCQRRIFGSFLLVLLAAMMIGSLFLDFDPQQIAANAGPPLERDAVVKQSVQFLSFYFISMLLVLMAILIVAVIDFWATARFSFRQQKQLLQEHQEMLQAELMEHRNRRSELN